MKRTTQVIYAILRIISTRGDIRRKQVLFREFRQLGSVYVKFLQVLAVNQRFMEGWSGPRERLAFEDAAFEPIDVMREVGAAERYITRIEPEPFAAGSFAVVYRAWLSTGDAVVLKILRPSVRHHLRTDLRLLGVFAGIFQLVAKTSMLDIRAGFKELRRTVEAEVDYEQEAVQAAWFYDYFSQNDQVVVPFTYRDVSNDHVIVQQYVGGVSLAEVMQAQSVGNDGAAFVAQMTGSNLWQQMALIGAEFLKTTLVADYVLADPHPGNIKLLADNKIGIIDFGMVAAAPINREPFLRLTREYQKLFRGEFELAGFTRAMMEYFDQRLVSCLDRVSRTVYGTSLLDDIGSYVTELVKDHNVATRYQAELRELRIAVLFNGVINEGNRFGVHVNLDLLMVQRAMLMFMSMAGSICRPAGLETYRSVTLASLTAAITHVEIHGLARSRQSSLGDDEAFEVTAAWLEEIADTNINLVAQFSARM